MPGATDSGDVLGRNVAQTCLLQLSGIGAVQHATFSSFLFWQFICSSSDVTWSHLSVLQPSAQLRDQERGRRLGRTGIGKRRGKKKTTKGVRYGGQGIKLVGTFPRSVECPRQQKAKLFYRNWVCTKACINISLGCMPDWKIRNDELFLFVNSFVFL